MSDDAMPAMGVPIGRWHLWWAWHPVDTFDRGRFWLRWVWRRRVQWKSHLPPYPGRWWQYRAVEWCGRCDGTGQRVGDGCAHCASSGLAYSPNKERTP